MASARRGWAKIPALVVATSGFATTCIDHRDDESVPPPPLAAADDEPIAAAPTETVPGAAPDVASAGELSGGAEVHAELSTTLATVQPLPHRTWVKHARRPGETVGQIAARYAVEHAELCEWNGLSLDGPTPKKGRRLRVKARRAPPPREEIEYVVREGDSWRSIAVQQGVELGDLRAYNWPHKGKMTPGSRIAIWIDPIVRDWIAAGPDPLVIETAGGIRRGGIGVGPPDAGHLVNGVRIPEGDGYRLRLPKSAYGTTHAVEQVVVAMRDFHADTRYGLTIELGAMSRQAGGDIGQHLSHQTGRDLDIRLPRRETVPSWQDLTPRRIDWAVAWELVRALAQTDVDVIFLDYAAQKRLYAAAKAAGATTDELRRTLQYPRGSATLRGIVRHIDGHDLHLHVRFACGPYETECMP